MSVLLGALRKDRGFELKHPRGPDGRWIKLFHVAPTEAQSSIAATGIESARTTRSSRWDEKPGFYAFADKDEAEAYKRMLEDWALAFPGEHTYDMWSVLVPEGEYSRDTQFHRDPNRGRSALHVRNSAPPERVVRLR